MNSLTKEEKEKQDSKRNKYRYVSLFLKWEIGIFCTVAILIAIYFLVDYFDGITKYQNAISHVKSKYHERAVHLTFTAIAFFAMLYVATSIFILLSHRSVEDSRMHCLPIIISPIFLVIENGFLHLFNNLYYEIMMTIFSAMVVGVITFASLKFSFELSSQRKRLFDTSSIKPDINILKTDSDTYYAEIKQNGCYFCGAFIGNIKKIFYSDIKKTGNRFELHNLFFPNHKVFFEKNTQELSAHPINFTLAKDELINEQYDKFLQYYNLKKSDYINLYWIFRDTQNFYYFAQMPRDNTKYNVIGVNEHMMTRLVYLYNREIFYNRNENTYGFQYKFCKALYNFKKRFFKIIYRRDNSDIVYRAMDWFKIPYNFYANIETNQTKSGG